MGPLAEAKERKLPQRVGVRGPPKEDGKDCLTGAMGSYWPRWSHEHHSHKFIKAREITHIFFGLINNDILLLAPGTLADGEV